MLPFRCLDIEAVLKQSIRNQRLITACSFCLSLRIFALQNVQKEKKMEEKRNEKIYFIFILCNGLEKNVMAYKNKLHVVLTLISIKLC